MLGVFFSHHVFAVEFWKDYREQRNKNAPYERMPKDAVDGSPSRRVGEYSKKCNVKTVESISPDGKLWVMGFKPPDTTDTYTESVEFRVDGFRVIDVDIHKNKKGDNLMYKQFIGESQQKLDEGLDAADAADESNGQTLMDAVSPFVTQDTKSAFEAYKKVNQKSHFLLNDS